MESVYLSKPFYGLGKMTRVKNLASLFIDYFVRLVIIAWRESRARNERRKRSTDFSTQATLKSNINVN